MLSCGHVWKRLEIAVAALFEGFFFSPQILSMFVAIIFDEMNASADQPPLVLQRFELGPLGNAWSA